jgi:hypothetical protein
MPGDAITLIGPSGPHAPVTGTEQIRDATSVRPCTSHSLLTSQRLLPRLYAPLRKLAPFCIGLATEPCAVEGESSPPSEKNGASTTIDQFRSPQSLFSNLDHSPLCLSCSTHRPCTLQPQATGDEDTARKTRPLGLRDRRPACGGTHYAWTSTHLARSIYTTLWRLGRGTSVAVVPLPDDRGHGCS